jgi:hypothetical protein
MPTPYFNAQTGEYGDSYGARYANKMQPSRSGAPPAGNPMGPPPMPPASFPEVGAPMQPSPPPDSSTTPQPPTNQMFSPPQLPILQSPPAQEGFNGVGPAPPLPRPASRQVMGAGTGLPPEPQAGGPQQTVFQQGAPHQTAAMQPSSPGGQGSLTGQGFPDRVPPQLQSGPQRYQPGSVPRSNPSQRPGLV